MMALFLLLTLLLCLLAAAAPWDRNASWHEAGGYGAESTDLRSVLMASDSATAFGRRGYVGEPPSPRSDHVAALVGDRIYVFGGLSASGELLDDLHFYDIRRGRWSGELRRPTCCVDGLSIDAIGPRPTARRLAAAAGIRDRFYVFGGLDPHVLRDIHAFDGAQWSGSLVTAGDAPAPRSAAAAAALNDLLYVFGGVDGEGRARADFSILNVTSLVWSSFRSTAPAPSPRAYAPLVSLDGAAYLVGGRAGDLVLHDTWQFAGDRWTRLDDALEARHSHALIATRRDRRVVLVVFGGQNQQGRSLDDQHAYDQGAWLDVSRLAPAPRRLGSTLVAWDGGRFALEFGGEGSNAATVFASLPVSRLPSFLVDRTRPDDPLAPGLVYRALVD